MRKRARFCSFRMILSNLDRRGMNHGEFFESEQRVKTVMVRKYFARGGKREPIEHFFDAKNKRVLLLNFII